MIESKMTAASPSLFCLTNLWTGVPCEKWDNGCRSRKLGKRFGMSPNMPQGFRSEFSSVPLILILLSIMSNDCSPLITFVSAVALV